MRCEVSLVDLFVGFYDFLLEFILEFVVHC